MQLRKPILAITILLASVQGCVVDPTGIKGPQPSQGNISKAQVDYFGHEPFSFEISSITNQSVEPNSDLFTVGETMVCFRPNQLVIDLKSESQVDLIKRYGGEILEQEVLLERPITHGDKESGTAKATYSDRKVKVPSYLVRFPSIADEDVSELASLATSAGLEGKYVFGSKRAAATMQKALKIKLENQNDVTSCGLNLIRKPASEGIRAGTSNYQDFPNALDFWWGSAPGYIANGASVANSYQGTWQWASGYGVSVAVIDGGFQGQTENYMPQAIVNKMEYTFNTVANDYSIKGSTGVSYAPWHGREVSSLIFAPLADNKGTLGMAYDAQPILIHTDFDANNNKQGIDQAVYWGAQVINMSYSWYSTVNPWMWDPEWLAIKNAYDNGVILIASAGNDGNGNAFPAAYNEVMSVSSNNRNGSLSYFSGSGNYANTWYVDLYAPGSGVAVAHSPSYNPLYFYTNDGTSYSAPIVSAAAALCKQRGKISNTSSAISWFRSHARSYSAGLALDAIWASY